MDRTSSTTEGGVLLALDVGAARIGVATTSVGVAIARPLTAIQHDDAVMQTIAELVADSQATAVVVGLPRGLNGQDTEQTKTVETFAEQLKTTLSVPLFWQDEALTSQKAEEELKSRGKPYEKGDIDALAACYILEDYLNSQEHTQI